MAEASTVTTRPATGPKEKAMMRMGTSLAVYPAAGLIDYYRGNRLVLINKSETPYDKRADLVIHESIGRVLSETVKFK